MERKVLREFYLITEKDANMMSLYLPPLTKTDKLFDEVFPRSIPSYGLIEEGYANCALLLLNSIILSNDNLVHDTYFFPALFFFRHYLELTIKATLKEYGKMCLGHNLSSLFESLRPHLSSGEDVENILCKFGFDCLNNYPLSEIDHIVENDLNVVLVDCMVYNDKTKEYEHVYRWFEVDEDFEEKEL